MMGYVILPVTNRVLRVKGAICPITFESETLGLLYRGHTRKK